MNYKGDLKELGKPFSELCVISENQKTFQGVVLWTIPNHEIKKHLYDMEKPIRSKVFSIGSPSFCSFYFLFQLNISASDAYLKPLSLSMVFNDRQPDSAWMKGKIHFDKLHIYSTFSVSGNSFKKRYDHSISYDKLEFYKLRSIYESDMDLTMHCSMKIITREVKCTIDSKSISYAESRNYDSVNEVLKHDITDVSISIGNHVFMTHKTLLLRIPYFQEMFDANEFENHFEIAGIDHEVFNHMLTYLKSGDIPILSFKLTCELYIVASDLKILGLKNLCSSYLGANITEVNVVMVLKLSCEYKDSALKMECFKFIKRSDVETLCKNSILL